MQGSEPSSTSISPTPSLHPRAAVSRDSSCPFSSSISAATASALELPATAAVASGFSSNGSTSSSSSSGRGATGWQLQQQQGVAAAAADAEARTQLPTQQQQQQVQQGDELEGLILSASSWQQLQGVCKRRRAKFTTKHTATAVIHLANLLRYEQEAAEAAASAASAGASGPVTSSSGSSSSSNGTSSVRSSLSSMSLSSIDDGSYWDTGAASSSYDAAWERSWGTTDHSLKASTSGRDTLYTSTSGVNSGIDSRGQSGRWEKPSLPAYNRASSSSSSSSSSSWYSSSSRAEDIGGKSTFLGLGYMLAESSSTGLGEVGGSDSNGASATTSSSSNRDSQGLLDARTMQARMQRLQQQRLEEQLQRQWQRRRPRTLRQQQLLQISTSPGSSSSSGGASESYSSQEKLLHSLLKQLLNQASQAGGVSPSRCAQVLSVLSRAGYSQPQLLGRLLAVAVPVRSLSRCSGATLVNLASVVALQGLQPKDKWLEQLGSLVQLQLKGLNPSQLAQVGFGLSRIGWVASEEWAGQLAEHMYPGMNQWRPQDFEMGIQVRGCFFGFSAFLSPSVQPGHRWWGAVWSIKKRTSCTTCCCTVLHTC